jgi:hypothetical protein
LEVGTETQPAEAPARSQRRRYGWGIAALAALVCLAAGFIHRGVTRPPIRIEPLPFAFHAQQRQDYLLLTWNPAARAVRNATRATLSIQDGMQNEDVEVSLATLRRGGIRYYPVFQDVNFRLTLANSPRVTVSEQAHPGFRP